MKLITGKTKLLGIIGDPIEHSLSPVMQNAAIAELGADYIYVPFPVDKMDLATAIAGFSSTGVKGFNITIPHKQSIVSLLSEITNTAKMVGAVNTVWESGSGWKGTNTDVEGFVAPLKEMSRDWSQSTAIVLGNGGAARAVVAGLAELGCGAIHIIGRDRQKLVTFYQSWNNTPQITQLLKVHYNETLPELLPIADLLVNTTPVGMYPHIDNSPISEQLIKQLKPDAIAYDLIYTPSPTKFLSFAANRGLKTIDGVEMLVQQGAAALKIWLQQPVPVNTMRNALKEQLFG